MKKAIFLISILVAILFACVPAPIKAQDPVKEYVVATPTTPIGRYIVANNFISVTSTGMRYEVTKAFTSTATVSSIITDGHYKLQPGTVKATNISASDSSVGYKIKGAAGQWYIIKVTASGTLTTTTTTAP